MPCRGQRAEYAYGHNQRYKNKLRNIGNKSSYYRKIQTHTLAAVFTSDDIISLINVDVYSANFGDACKKTQTTILTKSTWKDYDPPTPDAFARPQTNRCHVLVDEARHHQILLVRQRGGARSRASGSDHQRKLAFLNFIQVGRHLLRFTSALRQSSLGISLFSILNE